MDTVRLHDIEERLLTDAVLLLEQSVLRICSCDVSSDHLMMMMMMLMMMTRIVSDGYDL